MLKQIHGRPEPQLIWATVKKRRSESWKKIKQPDLTKRSAFSRKNVVKRVIDNLVNLSSFAVSPKKTTTTEYYVRESTDISNITSTALLRRAW